MEYYQEWIIEKKPEIREFLRLKKILKEKHVKVELKNNKIKVKAEDYFSLMNATKVVEAFLVGFPVDESIRLLDENYEFYTIDIREFAGKSYNHIRRLKGRVIGNKGKAKNYIKTVSGADLIISDKKIYILGRTEEALIAKESVERLLRGAPHSHVYRWMESKKKELKRKNLLENL